MDLLRITIFCEILITVTAQKESVHVEISETKWSKFPYHLKTTISGKSHHFRLKKLPKLSSEVFSPNFRFHRHFFNSKTNTTGLQNIPMTSKFKKSMCENIYTDPQSPGSHISITKDKKDGKFILSGFLTHDKVIKPGSFGNHTVVHHFATENVSFSLNLFLKSLTDKILSFSLRK